MKKSCSCLNPSASSHIIDSYEEFEDGSCVFSVFREWECVSCGKSLASESLSHEDFTNITGAFRHDFPSENEIRF